MQFEQSEECVSLDDFRFDKLYGELGYWRAMRVFAKERGIPGAEQLFSRRRLADILALSKSTN